MHGLRCAAGMDPNSPSFGTLKGACGYGTIPKEQVGSQPSATLASQRDSTACFSDELRFDPASCDISVLLPLRPCPSTATGRLP
jgi:hypothetical protein